MTLWLIAKVKTGQFDDLFSVESDLTLNTEHPITRTAIKPKRRRRIVKFSKEKRDHVQEEPEDSFNEVPIVQDDFPGGDALDRSLDQLMKNFGSKTSEPRRTPSLRSPLPLLSEIKCRISNDSRIR